MTPEAIEASLVPLFLELIRNNSKLEPSTPLYRITDFYSLAQTLSEKRLWMTRVSTYPDLNEGVDRLVKALYSSASSQGCGGFGAHDESSAAKLVHEERHCRFVSCWSKNPESHAMWSMYSPDLASVKARTTVGKLQELCALSLAEQWSQYYFRLGSEELKQTALLCDAEVVPARYEDLQHLMKRLARRTRLARRIVKDTDLLASKLGSAAKKRSSQWAGFLEPSVLKHRAFEYEHEVRVALRFGWEPALQIRHDEHRDTLMEASKGSIAHLRGLKWRLGATSSRIDETSLNHYSAPTPDGMIDAAFIDPRAPVHKRRFIEKFLTEWGVEVKKSEAFGLSYTGLDVYPDKPFAFI